MPLSRAFFPIVFNGYRFDRGCQLYEFSSQREADVPLTEYTGAYKDCGRFVRQVEAFVRRRVEMVEVPTPKMLWRGSLWPDLYISNQLDALQGEEYGPTFPETVLSTKHGPHSVDYPLALASVSVHGQKFHDTFIDPMCRKISGMTGGTFSELSARYNRALWLPMYYPENIIEKRSIPTAFHYPACGYAGVLAEMLGEPEPTTQSGDMKLDTVAINIAFLTGYPQMQESVIFVVDESPIYRVTNQEVCSGRYGLESRLVVEYRGECDPVAELARLGICADATMHGQITINYPLPTKENLQRCPTLYTSTMNDLILRHMLSTQQPGSTT